MGYLAVPESIRPEIDVALREAIVVGLPETADGTMDADALDHLESYLERAHAVAIGPGLGRNPDTDQFVEAFLRNCDIPVVVDADAITTFAGRADVLADIAAGTPLVITPHSGELARLLDSEIPEDAPARIVATARIAGELGLVLLHKGPTALVSDPEGRVFVNATGSSALATGGTGDVLTGFIASFLAQGAEPLDATIVSAFLHGRAGEVASEELGRRGVIAGDLLRSFGDVMLVLEAMVGD